LSALQHDLLAIFEGPSVYAPVCSTKHLPGHVVQADRLAAEGTDEIVCASVNHPFVMSAWAEKYGIGKVFMSHDPRAELTCVLGFDLDFSAEGLDQRSQHHSMVVVKGIATSVNVAKCIFDHQSSAPSWQLTPGPVA
jgi:glutaredoxin/glutathione-dependent peroxiredoxin